MSKALDKIKKPTYSDKIVEMLNHVAGKRINPDLQYWIHRYVNQMNLKLCPWGSAIRSAKELERYQKQKTIFVQNLQIGEDNKETENLKEIDMNKEFLVLLSKETGEGQKINYVMIYLPTIE